MNDETLVHAVGDVQAALEGNEFQVGMSEAIAKVLDAFEEHRTIITNLTKLCDFYRQQLTSILLVLRSQP